MILQKQIQTSKASILVIGGLPQDAHNFRMHKGNLHYDCLFALDPFDLPFGKWEPLGFLKDITKDMAREIIDFNDCPDPYLGHFITYRKYPHELHEDFCDTATESLHSLIESNCKLKNEYGEAMPELNPICCNILFTDRHGFPECCGMPIPTEESIHLQRLWEEEQSEVFVNPFLLKKI